MIKKNASNTFSEGIILDLNPLMASDKALTNALNATILTHNGNDNVLLNDMGNAMVGDAKLPAGYMPVGTCELGGIIYIASYNPKTQKGQIGSIPSPRIESAEHAYNTAVNIDKLLKEVNSTDKIYKTTLLSQIITKLDNERYSPGDSFHVHTLEGNHFPSYISNQFFTKLGEKEELIAGEVYTDGSSPNDHPVDQGTFDIFTPKKSGNLYLKTTLVPIEGLSLDNRTVTKDKTVYTIICKDKSVSEFIILDYKGSNYEGSNVESTGDTFTITIPNPNKDVPQEVTHTIIPVLEFTEEKTTIQRFDYSIVDKVDYSKVGVDVNSTVWRYSKDDTGMNLLFDVLDYTDEDSEIVDVKLEYISHRDVNKVNFNNTSQIIQKERAKSPNTKDDSITKNPGTNNQYTIKLSELRIEVDASSGFFSGGRTIITFEGDLVQYYSFEELNGEIKEIPNTLEYSVSSDWFVRSYGEVKLRDGIFSESNDFIVANVNRNHIEWSLEDGAVDLSDAPNSNTDPNTGITPDEPSGISQCIYYEIQYPNNVNDSKKVLKRENNIWYCLNEDGTYLKATELTGTLVKGDDKLYTNSSEYIFETGSNSEIWHFEENFGWTDEYLKVSFVKNESVKIDFKFKSAYVQSPTDLPNSGSGLTNPDSPNDSWTEGSDLNSYWIEVPLELRRFVTGLYKVSVPFDDYFIENSLYIVRLTINIQNEEASKSYCKYHILFTNGMYNKYFSGEFDNKLDFDTFSITDIKPTIDWNLTSEMETKPSIDTFTIQESGKNVTNTKIADIIFPKYIYDIYLNGDKTVKETLVDTVITKCSVDPVAKLEYGFNLNNKNVVLKSDDFKFSGNTLYKKDSTNEFAIKDEIYTNFNLKFSLGQLTIENYYEPLFMNKWSSQNIKMSDDESRIAYNDLSTFKLNEKTKAYSRFAGLSIKGGGEDGKGGGSVRYILGNYPLGMITKDGKSQIIQGREDMSPSEKDEENPENNEQDILKEAFGETSDVRANKFTEMMSQEENYKLKFPDDDFTDNLRISNSGGSNYPFFIPVLLVAGQSLFISSGSMRYFSTCGIGEIRNDNTFLNNAKKYTLPSVFRTFLVFCLTYVDGVYQYVPLNTLFLINDSYTTTFKFEGSGKLKKMVSNRFNLGELFFSYLNSMYHKVGTNKKTDEDLGYLSSFTATSDEERTISHTIQTPTCNVDTSNVLYDGLSSNAIRLELANVPIDNKACLNYEFVGNDLQDTIELEYTYTNPKFDYYRKTTEKTIERYGVNIIDDSILLVLDDDETELFIRENNSKYVIPINTKEKYNIPVLSLLDKTITSLYLGLIEENFEVNGSELNKLYGRDLSEDTTETSDTTETTKSKENTEFWKYILNKKYIKINLVDVNIPNDLFIYQNNKLALNYEIYRGLDTMFIRWYWKWNTNGDTSNGEKSRVKIADLELFDSYNFDSLPEFKFWEL